MKASKIVSVLLILLAVMLGLAAMVLCVFAVHQQPILVSAPRETSQLASQLMDAVCQGDYAAVSSKLQGTPELGVDREPADAVGKLLWNEFHKSMTYELKGDCYAADPGMAVDLSVTYLDFNSVISTLGDRVGKMLEQRAKTAKDPAELYDENNQYRQELVDEVLAKAAEQALKEDRKTVTEDLTLRMVYEQGHWWVVPDSALIHVISGGTAG